MPLYWISEDQEMQRRKTMLLKSQLILRSLLGPEQEANSHFVLTNSLAEFSLCPENLNKAESK